MLGTDTLGQARGVGDLLLQGLLFLQGLARLPQKPLGALLQICQLTLFCFRQITVAGAFDLRREAFNPLIQIGGQLSVLSPSQRAEQQAAQQHYRA